MRKHHQGAQKTIRMANYKFPIKLALVATMLLASCAPDPYLPADRAMKKHFPGFKSSDPDGYYDSLYRNLPTPQVNPRLPKPKTPVDWFTGKRVKPSVFIDNATK